MVLRRQKLLAAVLAVVALGAATAVAHDDERRRKRHDHDVARKALLSGEIRSLEAVVAEVRRTTPGEIVGVELEGYAGQWVYKIKVISPSGSMQRVTVDARRGAAQSGVPEPPQAAAPPPAPTTTAEPRGR